MKCTHVIPCGCNSFISFARVKFIHVISRGCNSFSSVALEVLPSGGHLVALQFGAITNGASKNILYMSFGTNLVLGLEFLGYQMYVFSSLVGTSGFLK